MKLDTKALRYLTADDWRVLAAVEQGSKNHEVVPTKLIVQLSGQRNSNGVHKCISNLAKSNLIGRLKNAKYDGYRLTYGGLDYLALHTHQKRQILYSVGNQIGVGKESDIFVVASPSGAQHVLKIHRLGRISFRTVKANRDYLRHRTSASWMYMSRLAALKEYTFMQALRANGFAVPEPIAQSRHTIVMSLVDAFPLRQISMVPDPAGLYDELIEMILQLARYGLIHGDFNEFNILIKEETVTAITTTPPASASASTFSNNAQLVEPISSTEPLPSTEQPCAQPPDPHNTTTTTITPILIDFPQMVSIDHANAAMYFDRDVQCIKRFFARRFHFTSDAPGPFFADARKLVGRDGATRLDVAAEASGFSKKMAKELEAYMREVGVDGDGVGGGVMGDEDEDGDEGDPDADADDEDTDEDGMEGESMEVKSKEVEKRLTNGVEEEIRGHSVVEISSQPQPEDQYSTTTESIAAEADGRHVSSGQSARLFENLQINNHT